MVSRQGNLLEINRLKVLIEITPLQQAARALPLVSLKTLHRTPPLIVRH